LKAPPTALVLKVKGEVRQGPRRVAEGDFLLPGQVVTSAAGAKALVVFLLSGQRGRLKPCGRTTLTRDGCDPADVVENSAQRNCRGPTSGRSARSKSARTPASAWCAASSRPPRRASRRCSVPS
jgi:hypothetical protein